MRKQSRTLCAAALVCCLLTTGCRSNSPEQPETTPPTHIPETTQAVVETAPIEPTALRQAMTETPMELAVAYFGYKEDPDSVSQFLQDHAPQLCQDQPFLLTIPEERILGSTGDLFCIVPREKDAVVTVTKGVWSWNDGDEKYTYSEIYRSETGDPLLLLCNNAVLDPDTQVVITYADGSRTVWDSRLDDNLCVDPMLDEDWGPHVLDFTPYGEFLTANYRDLMDAGWQLPSYDQLVGTTWSCGRRLNDNRDVYCRVTFQEGTCFVRWNDGIDEEDHEYPNAAWILTYEEDFAVLTIDFREFAGILKYNLLVDPELDMLYTTVDVTDGEPRTHWEPLYQYLLPIEN